MVFIESHVCEMVYILLLYLNQTVSNYVEEDLTTNCCSAMFFHVPLLHRLLLIKLSQEKCCGNTSGNYLYSSTPDEASIQTKGPEPGPCVPIQPRHLINYNVAVEGKKNYALKSKRVCRLDLPQQQHAC